VVDVVHKSAALRSEHRNPSMLVAARVKLEEQSREMDDADHQM
jgi:hypothetical protein